jgi:glucan phosphoethanolaminetransferase (alkaline phosphatase superfamily)
MRRQFLVILLILLLVCPVLGTNDSIQYNISYTSSQPNAAPLPIALFTAIFGIALLLLSVLLRVDQGADIIAIMATFPLLVAAWQFLTVDIVTGFGTWGMLVNESNQYGMLEKHTIYTMYPVAIILLVLFVISLFNVYRIVMLPGFISKDINAGDE